MCVCYDAARQLFQQGLQIDPLYLHLWQVCVSVLCDGRKGGVVVVFVGERGWEVEGGGLHTDLTPLDKFLRQCACLDGVL